MWSPDSRHLVTAATHPRLRTANGFRVFKYNGTGPVQSVDIPVLYQVWSLRHLQALAGSAPLRGLLWVVAAYSAPAWVTQGHVLSHGCLTLACVPSVTRPTLRRWRFVRRLMARTPTCQHRRAVKALVWRELPQSCPQWLQPGYVPWLLLHELLFSLSPVHDFVHPVVLCKRMG
jgi:hypothetical protein